MMRLTCDGLALTLYFLGSDKLVCQEALVALRSIWPSKSVKLIASWQLAGACSVTRDEFCVNLVTETNNIPQDRISHNPWVQLY